MNPKTLIDEYFNENNMHAMYKHCTAIMLKVVAMA